MPDYTTLTATPDDVIAPYSFIGKNQIMEAGKIKNQGAIFEGIKAGHTLHIPHGYHNGHGIVTADSLASQTIGTAKPEHVIDGMTLWVNGVQITGTIAVHDNSDYTELLFEAPLLYIGIPEGARVSKTFHISIPSDKMFEALKVDLDTIAAGQTIFKDKIGTYTMDADVLPGDIQRGYTAYCKGVKVEGALDIDTLF